jgi:hypothetical protein
VIDWSISKTASVAVNASYNADDAREGAPRGLLERGLRGASRAIDQAALTLQWKARVMQFDQDSPISSTLIVRGLVGLLTFAVARAAIRAASR